MADKGSSRPGAVRSAGTKKSAIIAVFVAATFGLMALLSVPFRFLPPALHIPAPIKGLNPFLPFIPQIPAGGREPGGAVSQALLGGGVGEFPLAAPIRSAPIPPPPSPGEKGPVLPPRVPSIDHRRASGENGFLPDVGQGHISRRAIHRYRQAQRHQYRHNRPNHPGRCHEQRQEEVARVHHVEKAAKSGHPHWRGGPGAPRQESSEARPSSLASRTRSWGGTGSLKRKP
jgi:hypothetical protein